MRNAQFKNFDTIVFMRLRPVWHKVGMKTKIHVQSLAELRDLQTWLLEYDSATFAAYVNTLQRQHFLAQKKISGPRQYIHDWFNAKAAALLVEGSQRRVSQPKLTMGGTASTDIPDGEVHIPPEVEFREDMEAAHELEERLDAPMGGEPIPEEDDDEVMLEIATQAEAIDQRGDEGEEDELHEVETAQPPVFKPVVFSLGTDLDTRVASRVRKGHEPVLEEQPKWALLARVLKEIEDTIARVADSHAGGCFWTANPDQPGNNNVLVMCSSDRTCLQLRQYLTTMEKTDPPFGPHAGRKMMQTLFLSNWMHEKNGERLSNPARYSGEGADEVAMAKSGMEAKRMEARRGGAPSYKRRRMRAGAPARGQRDT